jgi:hypothetical protein
MSNLTFERSRVLFLSLLSWCYFSSFVSYLVQVEGLYGVNGGLVQLNLSRARSWNAIGLAADVFNMHVDAAFQFVCAIGSVVALCTSVTACAQNVLSFALLWLLHFSIITVGHPFSSFQWDLLLCEAGFLAIFWQRRSSTAQFAVSFLLFRLMVSSALVKLLAETDGHWWRLTAIRVHLETTCLPHTGSWAFRQLPEVVHVFSTAAMFVIELLLPWYALLPRVQTLRTINALGQVLLQVAIMLTGNYTYFNALTIALAVATLDDSFWAGAWLDRRDCESGARFFALVAVLSASAGSVLWISLIDPSLWSLSALTSVLERVLLLSVALALVQLPFHIAADLFAAAKGSSLVAVLRTTISVASLCCLIVASFTPFIGRLHRPTLQVLPSAAVRLSSFATDLHLVSSYGLFASLTTTRDEIRFEGFATDERGWFDLTFAFKPNSPTSMTPVILPYQPRLDWQMWFAALQSVRSSPWLLRLAQRLLDRASFRAAASLMDPSLDSLPVPRKLRVTTRRFWMTENWNASAFWHVGEARAFIDGALELDAALLARALPPLPVPVDANDGKRHLVPLSRGVARWLIVSAWLIAPIVARQQWIQLTRGDRKPNLKLD